MKKEPSVKIIDTNHCLATNHGVRQALDQIKEDTRNIEAKKKMTLTMVAIVQNLD
jgi:hypothetical protein